MARNGYRAGKTQGYSQHRNHALHLQKFPNIRYMSSSHCVTRENTDGVMYLLTTRKEFFGCKAKHAVNEKGHCTPNWYRQCEEYCESYVEWWYGPEMRFNQTRCGPNPCRLKPGLPVEVKLPEWTSQITNRTFSMASNFNYWTPNTTASSYAYEKPNELLYECGYFAFIPYMVKSCGITTHGRVGRFWLASWCSGVTQVGECRETVLHKPGGEPDGVVVFVATDCNSHFKLRPFCKQDPIYLKDGVSFDPQLRKEYLSAFKNGDMSKELLREAWEACQEWSLDKTIANAEDEPKKIEPALMRETAY
ncbi:Cerebellar degeneration-related antigen-like protein [Ilyonectria robusta]